MEAMLTVSAVSNAAVENELLLFLFSIPWVTQERERHSLFNTQRIAHSDITDMFTIMHVFGGTLYLLDIGSGVRMFSAFLSILSQTADGVRERRMQDECKTNAKGHLIMVHVHPLYIAAHE
jgi:hypothetical protein